MGSEAQSYRDFLAFVRLGRPYFLAGGVIMHALGVSAALYTGATLDWTSLLLGQLAISSTQWMVHYANDYFDLAADLLNPSATLWSGGSQVLPNGKLLPHLAYRAALALAAIAVLSGAALTITHSGGAIAALLVGAALFLGWSYSAPPFRWLSRGIGELVTAFVVAVLTPLLGFYLQARHIPDWLPLVLWAPFCLQLAFQICVNFPDAVSDAAAGKRTLVVRNQRAATLVYAASVTGAYLSVPLMLLAGLPVTVVVACLLPAPIAAWLLLRALRGGLTNRRSWVTNEWGNVVLVMLTAAAEAVAFLLARP